MKTFSKTLASAAVAVALATGMSFAIAGSNYGTKATSTAPAMKSDIVDTAVSAGQFNTLAKALTEAGLVDTLKGSGPFTVFAPTDDAFAALPSGTVEALLGDVAALTDVLLYHVVDDKLPAETVAGESSIRTLQGSDAEVATDMNTVTIAGATIQITDIPASNGVIHVIDAVMIPQ